LKGFAENHKEFNELLYRMSGKGRLIEILCRFNEYIEKSQLVCLRLFGRGEQILVEHRRIVDAIAKQDADEAENSVRYHVHMAGQAFCAARTTDAAND
jgi:DNA-binding GntR family transcriptional regulator